MVNGIVKWFNSRKGFGFISGDDNQDYFLHISQLPQEVNVKEGDRVNFKILANKKGLQAIQIELE